MAKTNDAVPHLIEAATADTIYRESICAALVIFSVLHWMSLDIER